MAWACAFLTSKENCIYKGYNIFAMGCFDNDPSYNENNIKFTCVGTVGYKIDDILNITKKHKLENNIMIFSAKQLREINHLHSHIEIKSKELEKLELTKYVLSSYEIGLLDKKDLSNYNIALNELNKIKKLISSFYDFYKLFLKKKINYISNIIDLEMTLGNAEKKLINFSYKEIPEDLPVILLRKIPISYNLTQQGEGNFRETLFDIYEENLKKVKTIREKHNFDGSIFHYFLKKCNDYFY